MRIRAKDKFLCKVRARARDRVRFKVRVGVRVRVSTRIGYDESLVRVYASIGAEYSEPIVIGAEY